MQLIREQKIKADAEEEVRIFDLAATTAIRKIPLPPRDLAAYLTALGLRRNQVQVGEDFQQANTRAMMDRFLVCAQAVRTGELLRCARCAGGGRGGARRVPVRPFVNNSNNNHNNNKTQPPNTTVVVATTTTHTNTITI